MFLEKINNKSSLSQKVKQQSIFAKQQKLVIFLINLSNLVKMKNIFLKMAGATRANVFTYVHFFSSFH